MKAIFGVLSLLVVLAVIGLLMSKQIKTVTQVPMSADSPAAMAMPASGTVREQSQQIQDKVRADVAKALDQGARREEADK